MRKKRKQRRDKKLVAASCTTAPSGTTEHQVGIHSVMTVRQAADKWGVSIRRVSKLCQDGRVPGAIKPSARFWLIPADAEKPDDLRTRGKESAR